MIHYKAVAEILEYDKESGKLFWKERTSNRIHVGDEAGRLVGSGYVVIGLKRKLYYAHRLAWLLSNGEWPENQIDHINGERADNRLINLREATNSQNCQNKRRAISSNKSSKLLGSYLHKPSGKFLSLIGVNGKSKYLGYFNTPTNAHEAYLVAKRKLHEFCQI